MRETVIDTQDSELSVIGCKIHNAGDQAFEIRASSTLLVQDSEIYEAAYDGFHTNGSSTNATITIERCRIYNLLHGFGTPFSGTTADASELLKDPRFVDAANGDFRLAKGSPAINSGTDLTVSV